MTLRIKRRSQNEWMTLFILVFSFLFSSFIEILNFPSAVKYLIDVVWCLLLVTMVFRKKSRISYDANIMKYWIIAFFFYCFVNYIVNFQSAFYFLWGVRNNFRFYIFFLACIYYLNKRNIDEFFSFIDKIFYVHIVFVFVQYFIFGCKQDFLGGLFGTEQGCNGGLNIFQVIVVSYSVLRYLNRGSSFWKCLFNCAMCLLIAAMAELKFFFVEFAVIVVLVLFLTKFTWKKLGIILFAGIGLIIGIQILLMIFPVWKDSMSIKGLLDIASSDKGYTGYNDMNRLTVISMSNDLFLKTPLRQLFGLGLGNCDKSEAFSFLVTPFYMRYSKLHYDWMSSAFMYLENGFVGLIFYIGFFVLSFFAAAKERMRDKANIVYLQVTQVVAVMSVLIVIYNASLRTEFAYMVYFVLAVPFILQKNSRTLNGGTD